MPTVPSAPTNVSEFVNIHHGRCCSGSQTKLQILVNTLRRAGISDESQIDFIGIVHKLKELCGIQEIQTREALCIVRRTGPSRTKLIDFLEFVLRSVSTEQAYHAFCATEYNELFSLLVCLKKTDNVVVLHKKEVTQSDYAHERYQFFKMCVDNNVFDGQARVRLRYLGRKLSNKLCSILVEDVPVYVQQRVLEEKVAVNLHIVQLYGAAETHKRKRLLRQMLSVQTGNLDRTTLELTCHSKLAVTASKEGRSEEAEDHIRQTLTLCDICVPSFATVMALNDVLYAYQELYFQTDNCRQDLLERSTDHAELTYHIICCGTEDVVNQWKRIVLLFKAMTYLHISHEFHVDAIENVSVDNIKRSELIIKDVVKTSRNIEIRREMVLKLCKGRILEKTDRQMALEYIEEVADIMDEGCIRVTEKINIQNYLNKLRG